VSDPAAPPPIQRLGVLSDSHGRVASCRRAMSALRDLQVDAIVHLGDVGTPAVLEELVGDPPVHVVFGNCDDERDLATHARCMGLTVHHPLGRLEVAGRGVAFTHGHLREAFEATLGREPMLLTGHTHRVAADRLQGTRVVNPGALFRASRYTCAVVEGPDLRVSWIDVGRDEIA
jgi:putative phosphoesterase